jgi:heme A synthase
MMPAITRAFHELAWIIGWFAVLIVVSAMIAAFTARKYGRTKQARQAIYSVAGLVGMLIAAAITMVRLRGIKITP